MPGLKGWGSWLAPFFLVRRVFPSAGRPRAAAAAALIVLAGRLLGAAWRVVRPQKETRR